MGHNHNINKHFKERGKLLFRFEYVFFLFFLKVKERGEKVLAEGVG